MKDILKDNISLKEMPFVTPEGYFDRLKKDLKTGSKERGVQKQFTPYLALAAMFALLVATGGFFLERTTGDEFSQEDYIVFSEDMTNTIFYESDEQYADVVTDDDIIEYLIYIGTEIDELY